jgi:hypothetical protein
VTRLKPLVHTPSESWSALAAAVVAYVESTVESEWDEDAPTRVDRADAVTVRERLAVTP